MICAFAPVALPLGALPPPPDLYLPVFILTFLMKLLWPGIPVFVAQSIAWPCVCIAGLGRPSLTPLAMLAGRNVLPAHNHDNIIIPTLEEIQSTFCGKAYCMTFIFTSLHHAVLPSQFKFT